MKTLIELTCLLLLLSYSWAADSTHIEIGWDGSHYNPPDGGHKIGLALSGGGARGLAQLGILKAFEEAHIQIGAIAGTSFGGIVGGLYAVGYSADSIKAILDSLDFTKLFSDRPTRNSMFLTQRQEKERFLISIRFDGLKPYIPQALTDAQKLSDLLSALTLKANYISGGDFLKFKYPFCSVTTDIVTGRQVNLTHGNLADALRSTMAFPLAFSGVDQDNMLLMDGGIVNPIPVSAIPRNAGRLDLIVAVNTTSNLLPKDAIIDPIDIANQVTSIMQIEKISEGLNLADVVITPDLDHYNSSDFKYLNELIEKGLQAGRQAVPKIRNMLKATKDTDSIYINSTEIQTDFPDNYFSDYLPQPGDVIDRRSLWKMVEDMYLKNDLYSLTIDVIPSDDSRQAQKSFNLKAKIIRMPKLENINIVVKGNLVFDDSTIISALIQNWNVSSPSGLERFSDSLNMLYSSEGYDLSCVNKINYLPQKKILQIIINEAKINNINISGNNRTKNWLINSSFALRPGKPFNSRDAARGIRNIYGTDLFDRVTMNILPDSNGANIKIAVEEKKYSQIRLGWHWHDEYRSEQFIELLNDNLLGTGQEFLMHAQYASRRQKYEISLKADRFFSTYLTYRVKTYYTLLKRYLYDIKGDQSGDIRENRWGVDFSVGQQISRFGTVTGEIRWEDIENKFSVDGTYDKIHLRTATIRSHVETINKYPFPTEGKKHIFFVEFAADILGGETRYTKLFSSLESYFPLSDVINFRPRLSIGWSTVNNSIPISEKFYMGGSDSFHGYKFDQLWGDKMFLGNLDLRFKLPYRFYLTGHYDFGEVYKNIDQIKLSNLRHGYGATISYDSPIGPVDIGFGKADDSSTQLYINLGLAF